jgi:predicted ABC-type ATPase/predicted double-glycine peptidase
MASFSTDADWDEAKHPRAKDGKFGEGGAGGSASQEKEGARATPAVKARAKELVEGWSGNSVSARGMVLAATAASLNGEDPKEAIARKLGSALESYPGVTPEKLTNIVLTKVSDPATRAAVSHIVAASQKASPATMTLYRGIGGKQADQIREYMKANPGKDVPFATDSASSFSEDEPSARAFGRGGFVMKIEVPRASVLLSYRAFKAPEITADKEVVIHTAGGFYVKPADLKEGGGFDKVDAIDVPAIAQTNDYNCGAAALLSVLKSFGVRLPREKDVAVVDWFAGQLGTTPENGTRPEDIVRVAIASGTTAEWKIGLSLDDLRAALAAEKRVILDLQEPDGEVKPGAPDGHYVVLTELDQEAATVMNPSGGTFDRMPIETLLDRWIDEEGRYGAIFFGGSKADAGDWDESKHPRAKDGKFGEGGGTSSEKKGMLSRAEMPQIRSHDVPEFLNRLRDKGIKVELTMVRVGDLKATQKEINPEKVQAMKGAVKENEKPIIMSEDGHILDGHHRWAGMMEHDPDQRVPVYKVHAPIEKLLEEAHAFPKSEQHGIEEKAGPRPKAPTGEEKLPNVDRWVDHADGLPKETWMTKMTGNPAHEVGVKATPERQPLHDRIVQEFDSKAQPVPANEAPTAILTMGGPASGKTSIVRAMGIDDSKFVKVDPDAIKERLPEFREATGLDHTGNGPRTAARDAAYMAHEESSFIAKRIRDQAITEHKNVVIDGTGAKVEKFVDLIKTMKSKGYQVKVFYPDLDVEEGLTRANDRAQKSGRMVPEPVVRDIYSKIATNFQRIVKEADEFAMFDARPTRAEGGAKLVWTHADGKDTMHDPIFVAQFKKEHFRSDGKRAGMRMDAQQKKPSISLDEAVAMFKTAMDTEQAELEAAPVRFDPSKGEGIEDVNPIEHGDDALG